MGAFLGVFLGALPGLAPRAAAADPLVLERVVIFMRHSVRPPVHLPVLPPGAQSNSWPAWPVLSGQLTPHGAEAARLMGVYDRLRFAREQLLPARGCPAPGTVSVYTDTNPRTVTTGDAWLEGLTPGCNMVAHHAAQRLDPLFAAVPARAVPFDPAAAAQAIEAEAPDGLTALLLAHAPALTLLQHILGCCSRPLCPPAATVTPGEDMLSTCDLAQVPNFVSQRDDRPPEVNGAIPLASVAAETLMLEYEEGLPMADVGWGRASHDQIADVLVFHPLLFELTARTPYIAQRAAAGIAARIVAALQVPVPSGSRPDRPSDPATGPNPGTGDAGAAPPSGKPVQDAAGDGTRVAVLVGHDANIAALGGLLGIHWKVADFPADDPPPVGSVRFELLRDPASGQRFVRVRYVAPSMDQVRRLSPLDLSHEPAEQILSVPGCGAPGVTLCPLDRFAALVAANSIH